MIGHDFYFRGFLMGGDLALRDDRSGTTLDEFYEKSWFIGFSSLPESIKTWIRNNDERSGTLNGLQRIGLRATTGTRGSAEDIEEDKKNARFWQWVLDQGYAQLFRETYKFILHVQDNIQREIVTLDRTIEAIQSAENSGNVPPGARSFLKHKKRALKKMRHEYAEFDENILQPATKRLENKQNPPSIEELKETGQKVSGMLGTLKKKTAAIFQRGKDRAINGFYKYRAKGEVSDAPLRNNFAASAGNDNAPSDTDQDNLSAHLPTDDLD